MCETKSGDPGDRAETRSDAAGARGSAGCPCEPRRCLPAAIAVLAVAATVPLVLAAVRRSRDGGVKKKDRQPPAGCCG